MFAVQIGMSNIGCLLQLPPTSHRLARRRRWWSSKLWAKPALIGLAVLATSKHGLAAESRCEAEPAVAEALAAAADRWKELFQLQDRLVDSERDVANALAHELDNARKELQRLKQQNGAALGPEDAQNANNEQRPATGADASESNQLSPSNVLDIQRVFGQQREKVNALAHDLDAALKEVQAGRQNSGALPAVDDVRDARHGERPAGPDVSGPHGPAASEFARVPVEATGPQSSEAGGSPQALSTTSVPIAVDPSTASNENQKLIVRAGELLSQGDVSGARLFLERAVRAGNARAAFMLAETYDPQRLSRRQTVGVRADPKKARELYTRALEGGIAEAKDRISQGR